MYGKKIKYYRMKNGLTVEQLASKLSCTKAAVSQYENDKRDPDDKTVDKIAKVFGITWAQLISVGSNGLQFNHFGFRKKMSVTKNEIEVLKEDIESKCKDRIDIMSILGILPEKPFKPKKLSLETSVEENVKEIRKVLKISSNGPVYSVTNILERLGIIVLTFDCPEDIEGLNGTVNNIPYIFFNSSKNVERQRFTLMHEFCHLFFNHLDDSKNLEKCINKLAGHVLISDTDIFHEFGKVNRNLNRYFLNSVAREYKIAPSCLITRLYETNVITEMYYRNFFKFLNARIGRSNEETLLEGLEQSELPTAFNQQVYRALDEELISKSRAAELLAIPLFDIMKETEVI